jgi:hypothetical protein
MMIRCTAILRVRTVKIAGGNSLFLEQGPWRLLVAARQESAEVATSHWPCLNPSFVELVNYAQLVLEMLTAAFSTSVTAVPLLLHM